VSGSTSMPAIGEEGCPHDSKVAFGSPIAAWRCRDCGLFLRPVGVPIPAEPSPEPCAVCGSRLPAPHPWGGEDTIVKCVGKVTEPEA